MNSELNVSNTLIQGEFSFKSISIAYAYKIPPLATQAIVISSGRIECYLKYQELINEFIDKDFAVFVLDHPGQGLSSRLLKNRHKGHIQDFDNYVECFNQFNLQVVNKQWNGTKYLVAHSMGAAIAYLYLKQYPTEYDKAVFSAPMFGINTGSMPLPVAKMLTYLFNTIGLGNQYCLGHRDYTNKPFQNNQLTSSQVRYKKFRQLYNKTPAIQLGGVTNRWLLQAFKAIKEIHQTIIHTPTLILQAENDTVVCNGGQNDIVQQNKCIKLIQIQGAKHEVLFESDSMRNQALNYLYQFLSNE